MFLVIIDKIFPEKRDLLFLFIYLQIFLSVWLHFSGDCMIFLDRLFTFYIFQSFIQLLFHFQKKMFIFFMFLVIIDKIFHEKRDLLLLFIYLQIFLSVWLNFSCDCIILLDGLLEFYFTFFKVLCNFCFILRKKMFIFL